MNDELKLYLEGMETRILERIDEQSAITSKAFSNLESYIGERFATVDERFDRIENVLIARHDTAIERLVDDVRLLKTKLGIA